MNLWPSGRSHEKKLSEGNFAAALRDFNIPVIRHQVLNIISSSQ
jgi:hypothetical protein